jgi:hypothetical protein
MAHLFASLLAVCLVGLVSCDKHHYLSAHHLAHHRFYDADKVIDYFLKNEVTKKERECFESNLKLGDSIDFVIDLAPSPSLDQVDKKLAKHPVGLYLEQFRPFHSPSRTYFDFITKFIDIVSYDMKPELTHSVIFENGRKFYLRGRAINETIDVQKAFGGESEFEDAMRNLKTMWPASTKSFPETLMAKILVNNLGRMTKLALWNRDNGLPTVLNGSKKSKSVYTIVLTDGSSGATIDQLSDDLSRTTVIDLGNHRFVENLKWEQVRLMPSVFTLTAPQILLAFADSVRNMACLLATNRQSSSS